LMRPLTPKRDIDAPDAYPVPATLILHHFCTARQQDGRDKTNNECSTTPNSAASF